jgi:hypothetical protein
MGGLLELAKKFDYTVMLTFADKAGMCETMKHLGFMENHSGTLFIREV